jgi:uncharacterized protein (DUF433 family)
VTFPVQAEAPPLREDASGALRVGASRVLLELVLRAFQDGATPEAIVQRYSTLALPDVYAVIAYYLRHRSEVEGYLAQREQKAEEVRQRLERQQGDLGETRARLLARQVRPGKDLFRAGGGEEAGGRFCGRTACRLRGSRGSRCWK